jgi:hypothetical protein
VHVLSPVHIDVYANILIITVLTVSTQFVNLNRYSLSFTPLCMSLHTFGLYILRTTPLGATQVSCDDVLKFVSDYCNVVVI